MTNQQSIPAFATIRQNRGISLQQIAASTKISVRSLEAIEQGEFGKLPGGIYSTSYIRQYARAIDYDEGEILEIYRRTMNIADPETPGTGKNGGSFGNFRPASHTTG
jgi:cytoskeleton protein RodZ